MVHHETRIPAEDAVSTDFEEDKPPSSTDVPRGTKDVEHSAATASEKPITTGSPAKTGGPPGPAPPDGGLQAWLQVVGGFCLFFNTWGNQNTFGVFQTYYESDALFTETSSNIAWIGATQSFLMLFVGMLSGPLFDLGYLRPLLIVGSLLTVLGYMMLSLCTSFWQVVLAQGVCTGIGGGLLFIPAIAILPTYFRRRLGLAIGLAAAGSSMGGVIYPIVFYRLIGQIGFAWGTRVLGFIALVTLVIPCVVMKQRVRPTAARAIIDRTAFSDAPYLVLILGCLFGFVGLYTVFFYLSFAGVARGITDESLAFYLVPILNAASVFGRTVPNAVSDRVGTLNLLGPGGIVCSALVFGLIGVTHSAAALVVEAVLFGFFSGVFIALPPVCYSIFTEDKSKIGTRMGMGFAVLAFAVLAGGPGGGAVLGADPADLHWTSLWTYGGVTLFVSGVALTGLRVYKAGWKLMVKV